MTDRITVIDTETLADDWGTLTRVTFDYRRTDGTVQRMSRENYDHGNAAAILLVDPARDTVLLVRQFRFPPTENGDPGFMLEVAAGLLDGDTPEACAAREALEEAGHAPENITHVCDTYMSPGSVQEKLHLFMGEYNATTRRHTGGGLLDEGEETEVVELAIDQALAMIRTGEITDGKTVLLLQHLALRRAGLA